MYARRIENLRRFKNFPTMYNFTNFFNQVSKLSCPETEVRQIARFLIDYLIYSASALSASSPMTSSLLNTRLYLCLKGAKKQPKEQKTIFRQKSSLSAKTISRFSFNCFSEFLCARIGILRRPGFNTMISRFFSISFQNCHARKRKC